ncbi:MAG: hypothetical protein OXU20_17880 [Myxococcales bacterium]|nr:hypothetical protein [Myxococcales bacterium]
MRRVNPWTVTSSHTPTVVLALVTRAVLLLVVFGCETPPIIDNSADAGSTIEVRASGAQDPGESDDRPEPPGGSSDAGPQAASGGAPASDGAPAGGGGEEGEADGVPAGTESTQGQAGESQPPCQAEGTTRCGVAVGQREVCMAGAWVSAEPCPDGNVCIMSDAQGPSCQAVAAVCQGSAGQAVCDGNGVMYLCSASGLVESMTTCASARHCQLGKTAGTCASCAPGAADGFKCDGASLMRCTPLGEGYEPVKTCDTASLCNAVAGDCTDAACSPGQHVCEGDTLKRCNADQTMLETVKTCGSALCDAEAGDCDVCVSGEAACEGNTAVICDDQGTHLQRMPCPSATPVCVGEGRCVECEATSDCAEPGACNVANCDRGRGVCAPMPAQANTACMNGMGYCDGRGTCLGCNTPSQCDDPPACHDKACVSGMCQPRPVSGGACSLGVGSGVCLNGDCVACRDAHDCSGDPGACKQWECSSNRCRAVADDRASCTIGLLTPGTCSDGRCVECVTAGDCGGGTLGQCETATCTGGRCGTSGAMKEGRTCTLSSSGLTGSRSGTCGDGRCVECRTSADCDELPGGLCSNGVCKCGDDQDLFLWDPNHCGRCGNKCDRIGATRPVIDRTPLCVDGHCSECYTSNCADGYWCSHVGGPGRCVNM